MFEGAPSFRTEATAEKRADQRGQSVAVAEQEIGDEIEKGIGKGSCGQGIGAEMTHHHGVGKTHNDDAQLTDGDRKAEAQRGFVFGFEHFSG